MVESVEPVVAETAVGSLGSGIVAAPGDPPPGVPVVSEPIVALVVVSEVTVVLTSVFGTVASIVGASVAPTVVVETTGAGSAAAPTVAYETSPAPLSLPLDGKCLEPHEPFTPTEPDSIGRSAY